MAVSDDGTMTVEFVEVNGTMNAGQTAHANGTTDAAETAQAAWPFQGMHPQADRCHLALLMPYAADGPSQAGLVVGWNLAAASITKTLFSVKLP
jgi:hypothetical protein